MKKLQATKSKTAEKASKNGKRNVSTDCKSKNSSCRRKLLSSEFEYELSDKETTMSRQFHLKKTINEICCDLWKLSIPNEQR